MLAPPRRAPWALALALLVAAPTARADAALDAAARHFEEGSRLYAAGSYRDAIDEFEAAHAIAPAPANLFNLARCYEKLAELRIALEHYQRYLEDQEAPERQLVERRIADLRAMPVDLFVSTAPSDARVLVDGMGEAEPERTPSVVRLRPGRHVVRVERDGHLTAERFVDLRSLTPGRVHFDLAPADRRLRLTADDEGDPVGVDPASLPSVLEEIRTRREDRSVLWRLSAALGASKYDDTAFVVGLDGGPVWKGVLFNLHWLAMTSSFTNQILGEVLWDVALDDLDLFVGLGAGAAEVRRNPDFDLLPTSASGMAFVGEIVGGIDFFLRRQLALGMTLRLQVPMDSGAREDAGVPGDDPTLLVLAAGHVALHL
jgi:tetratricopeptide (TPR) repeat protein